MTQSDTEYIKQCLNGHADQYRFLVQRYQTVVIPVENMERPVLRLYKLP